jgi:hypothetical protein
MGQTGMAVARCINRIARQRLEGQDLRLLAPAGFRAPLTNSLIVQAVAWTAALRERLRAVVAPAFVPATGVPKADRAPQGRGAAHYLPKAVPNPTEDDWLHDWRELAKPLRIGPAGVAAAARLIADKSNREVVAGVSDKLQRASAQLGAAADVDLIAAMEAEALALLREAEAAAAAPDSEAAAPEAEAGAAGAAKGAAAAEPSSHAPGFPAEHDPPSKGPPDG